MAITEWYVDPTSGDDGTGDGSISTPWATVDHALNNIGTPGTDGDRINVKSGATSEAGGWTLSDYAASAGSDTPLMIEGYTTTRGDGGQATVDGAGSMIGGGATAFEWAIIRSLKFEDWGSSYCFDIDRYWIFENCIFDGQSARTTAIDGENYLQIYNCAFIDFATGGNIIRSIGKDITHVIGCYFSGDFTRAVYCTGRGNAICGNLFKKTSTGISTCINGGYCSTVMNNTMYAAGEPGNASYALTVQQRSLVAGNYVEGWSGTANVAIQSTSPGSMIINNYHYDNTDHDDYTEPAVESGNTTPGSSQLDAPGSDDFTIETNGSSLKEKGYPETFNSIAQDTFLDVGAIQREEPAGGGGGGSCNIIGG